LHYSVKGLELAKVHFIPLLNNHTFFLSIHPIIIFA